MPHTAHRRSLSAVCCKKQQQKKTRCAQQCTSSLLIPCAHVALNVKHHRTTPKPEIHITVEKAVAVLARKYNTKQNEYKRYKRYSTSSAGMYVYKRG